MLALTTGLARLQSSLSYAKTLQQKHYGNIRPDLSDPLTPLSHHDQLTK